MAPHVWQGATATQDWYRDVLVEGKQHGASDYFITLAEPLHNNVTGDSAYVVVPVTMTFKLRGEPVTQSGAVFTVALRKLPEGWRIAAWAWAKGTSDNNIRGQTAHDCFWHEADLISLHANVCLLRVRQTGQHLLKVSFSAFDPRRHKAG